MILMALGGAIAAAGLVSEAVPQTTSFVAASIIAPGFEPIAKIPLGLILRQWNVVRKGLYSTVAGDLVLLVGAAARFLLLRAAGEVTVADLTTNHGVERIAHPKLIELLVSACAAVAGVITITAFRRSAIAGPLIALILISAAATVGAALAAGEGRLVLETLQRLGLDGALIVGLGALVFGAKQLITHRRASID